MAWWQCPNSPSCGHAGALHDVEEFGDPIPTCCVEGCPCGHVSAEVRAAAWAALATDGHMMMNHWSHTTPIPALGTTCYSTEALDSIRPEDRFTEQDNPPDAWVEARLRTAGLLALATEDA